MAFPYFSPLSPWIVNVMEEREKNPILASIKNPFVILTSGALVVQSTGNVSSDPSERKKQIIKLIKDPGSEKSYKGCIISNNINDRDLTYSKNETIVGIDFTGQKIKVIGEEGRNISTPIIENLEIDTDGANNTLKTARVSVRLFSLKQLEMFEMFYMKPGMNVLVEFGDGSLFKMNKSLSNFTYDAYNSNGEAINFNPYSSVDEALVPKNDYSQFYNNFSDYFRSSTTAFAKYVNTIERSLGTYDLVAGKVLDYSFSVEDDGTYLATIEVSQGNQISLAIGVTPKVDKSTAGAQNSNPAPTKEEQLIEILSSDLKIKKELLVSLLSSTQHPDGDNTKNWLKKEFFNFFKINTKNKETTANDKRYISLRFVLKILANYVVSGGGVDTDYFKLVIPTYKLGTKEIEIIPVTSNKYIISSNESVIYPTNELPKFKSSNGEIVVDKDSKPVNGLINGYNFHISGQLKEVWDGVVIDTQNTDARTGNALNIFVHYEEVVKMWNKSYTRADFLEQVLQLVNKNSYGLFALSFGLRAENSGPSIIDTKMKNSLITKSNDKTYRFKPTTINSIVRSFSFNFEMSNLVAGRTIFNSGKFLAEASQKDAEAVLKSEDKLAELPDEVFKSVDNSTFGNADGWYSINRIELERIIKDVQNTKQVPKVVASDTKEDETTTKSAEDWADIINNKSVKYVMDDSGDKIDTLVFEDTKIIQNEIKQEINNTKKPTLSPIDITLTIDGFSGFRCGQYFNVDGIPEIYNKIGIFQITNTKHSISNDGWITTLEASFNLTP